MKPTFILCLLYLSYALHASQVEVLCPKWQDCHAMKIFIEKSFKDLKDIKAELFFLRTLALDTNIKQFKFIGKIYDKDKRRYEVYLELKPQYSSVSLHISQGLNKYYLNRIVDIKKGDAVDKIKIEKNLQKVTAKLKREGFIGVETSYSLKGDKIAPEAKIFVSVMDIVKVQEVILRGDIKFLNEAVVLKFKLFQGLNFNKELLLLEVQKIKENLFQRGFYKINLNINFINGDRPNFKKMIISINLGVRSLFDFVGNRIIKRRNFLSTVRDFIQNEGEDLNPSSLRLLIQRNYIKKNIYNTKIKIRIEQGYYKNGSSIINYYVDIKEGHKIRVKSIRFDVEGDFTSEKVRSIYYENASAVASSGFFDDFYLKKFSEIMKNILLGNGHLFSLVMPYQVKFDEHKKNAVITYLLRTRRQTFIDKINLLNISDQLAEKIYKKIKNRVGDPLNIIDMENDLKLALQEVRNYGYFFAEINNLDNIILYKNNYRKADITIDFNVNKKMIFKSLVIIGNIKTKKSVIQRENHLKKGDVINPEALQLLRNRLKALGLFSNIWVRPYVITSDNLAFEKKNINQADVLVRVSETTFGTGAFALGYRTDLGAKFSFDIGYKNLWGCNHSLFFKTQVNRRLSLGEFDKRRRRSGHHLIEGLIGFDYQWPYLSKYFDGHLESSFQRKRFFTFDADIWQVSPQASKQFTKNWSGLIEYQFERIRQFDATERKDQTTFKIGSFTPSLRLDYRDSAIIPRSGFILKFSGELTTPYLFLMRDDRLEVNFIKLISRNRFYYPLFNRKLVVALSFSIGYQVNFSTNSQRDAQGNVILNTDGTERTIGYIPSIKAFRLDGFDSIRGYSDEEANLLSNGLDINQIRVQRDAYFTNVKFEPRYYFNDNLALGLFIDIGNLYVNSFRPFEVKSAGGVNIKFLTPVGSLDFSYGLKFHRKTMLNGQRETAGRFQLSVGLFKSSRFFYFLII